MYSLGNINNKVEQEIIKRYTGRYDVTLSVSPTGCGTVSGSGNYAYREVITIKATPEPLYQFIKWNDGNTEAERQIVIRGNVSLIAIFKRQQGKVIFKPNY